MFTQLTYFQLLLISLISAIIVIFPDITWLPYDLNNISDTEKTNYIAFFFFRYIYYAGLIFLLAKINLRDIKTSLFKKRLVYNLSISLGAYGLYGAVSFMLYGKVRHFGSLVLFQFFIISILSTLLGYIVVLYAEQRKREKQIEALKIKNLQSRYDALTNQINPHFFFNSLNSLSSLIRKQDDKTTLTYVNKLSDVFRYILQSEKKGLVSLRDELAFVQAFGYMMEVRFAHKLKFNIDIEEEKLALQLPVLSILPLLDNIVVHNKIDSDHKMAVNIYLNDKNNLVVSNPIYPKLTKAQTNGTGLKNLETRFHLLMQEQISVKQNEDSFEIHLPLKP